MKPTTPKRKVKKVKAYVAIQNNGIIHKWSEGRLAVYTSTHGGSLTLQRRKQPENFTVIPCTISYSLPTNKKEKSIKK